MITSEIIYKAASIIISSQSGSTSVLQRKLKLDFNEACQAMRILGEYGVVGEFNPNSTRKILMTQEDVDKILKN
jgi:S-DNA-T family DNA segregation ATPase FtsK/SpoIIIE